MALAFDAVGPSAAGQTATAPTSVTWSHTVTGSQTALVVFVAVGDSSNDTTKTISGVTYNGVAMTQIGTPKHCNNATVGYLACYGLIAPATGAHNVVVSFASAPSTAQCGSLSFTGADQTAPFGTPVSAAGTGSLATAAVASNTSGNVIAFGVGGGSGFFATPTSPATLRWEANFSGSSGGGNGAGATIPATGSSVTCSWGLGADFWALIAVEVKAASGGNSWTQSPTDTLGLSDAGVAFIHSEVGADPLGLTDSVGVVSTPSGTNWTQSPADPQGLTDSAVLIRSTAALDSEGLTDATVFDRSTGIADPMGTTDSAQVVTDHQVTPADTEGLTDTLVLSYQQAPLEGMGLTDSAQVSLSGAGSVSATDASGLSDLTVLDQAHVLVDPEGLQDTATIDQSKTFTESEGLTDSAQVSLTSAGTVNVADLLGLSDPVAFDQARLVADTTGLNDQALVTKIISSADPVGLTDSMAFGFGLSPIDVLSLTDTVAISGSVSPVDSLGMTDSATVLLNTVRSIIDNAALSDAVQVLLMLPPTFGTASAATGPVPSASAAVMTVPTATGG